MLAAAALAAAEPARAQEAQRAGAGGAIAVPRMPVAQRTGLREQGGLPRRPLAGGLAQVDPPACGRQRCVGTREKPGPALAQAQEGVALRSRRQRRTGHCGQLTACIQWRASLAVQHQDPRIGPRQRQCRRVVAQVVGAVERAVDERMRRGGRAHIVNDEPQPQVVLAFGLRITNWAPPSDSL